MTAGRPPKSTAELKRSGAYRKDRHGDRVDITPWPGMPELPDGFTAYEQQIWDRVATYVPDEILAGADTEALLSLCKWWGIWMELVSDYDSAEKPEDRPKLIELSRAWTHVEKLLGDFGMTPASRSKIKVVQPKKKEEASSPLSAYVA